MGYGPAYHLSRTMATAIKFGPAPKQDLIRPQALLTYCRTRGGAPKMATPENRYLAAPRGHVEPHNGGLD